MIEISNLTKRNLPSSKLRFAKIKETVLGKKYELSLVFIGNARSKTLNKKHRGKNYPANVLSFPLEKFNSKKQNSPGAGEIFISLDTEKEAKDFSMSHKKYIEYLLIHGALHLKGFDHGTKMSFEEQKYLNKIGNK